VTILRINKIIHPPIEALEAAAAAALPASASDVSSSLQPDAAATTLLAADEPTAGTAQTAAERL
jgi:hypothetical protein